MNPPEKAIEMAREAALQSPCAKSRRGVVIFDHERIKQGLLRGNFIAIGHNGPPEPFVCDGSDACRRDCGKICVHAEQNALRDALAEVEMDHVMELELLHVKVVDGAVVAGGPPSCWQCSREILDAKLAGVWLYEEVGALAMHIPGQAVRSQAIGEWRFYTALEFHEATLKNCGLHIGGKL